MDKTFLLSGGAGRIITAIPALTRYAQINKDKDFKVIIHGWSNLYNCHPILHNKTFDIETKGIFDLVIKNSELICPEPYHLYDYYNQNLSLADAFDVLINGDSHLSLRQIPTLHLHSNESYTAKRMIEEAKKQFNKTKFIVFQPYGSGCQDADGKILDTSGRSLSREAAEKLCEFLSKDAVVLYFGDNKFAPDITKYQVLNSSSIPGADLRFFMAMIANCDYFIGVDSVGQHMARAFNKPGTIFMGSTFEVNVSYPEWFNFIRRQGYKPSYSPIRISPLDISHYEMANDGIMDFDEIEIEESCENIKEKYIQIE